MCENAGSGQKNHQDMIPEAVTFADIQVHPVTVQVKMMEMMSSKVSLIQ